MRALADCAEHRLGNQRHRHPQHPAPTVHDHHHTAAPSRCAGSGVSGRSGPSRPGRRRRARPSTSTSGSPASTAPITVQPSGSTASGRERRGQRVVLTAGEQPVQRVDAQRRAHLDQPLGHRQPVGAQRPRAPRTPRATCPRSASSPSDTSIMAVAPASAACGPAAYGGSGTRCAPTTATGERKPRASTASPAAAQPIRPHSATRSPGRAPARVTGARPSSEPSAVTDSTMRRGRGQVAADQPDPDRAGLRPQPVGQPGRRRPSASPAGRPARPAAPWAPRPSPRCRPGWPPPPCARPARAGPVQPEVHARRPARRCWPPPARRARRPRPRRPRARAASPPAAAARRSPRRSLRTRPTARPAV